MKESAPCTRIASIIIARDPLPLNGRISAVGMASTHCESKPIDSTTHLNPSTI